jgi:hypothetical protein
MTAAHAFPAVEQLVWNCDTVDVVVRAETFVVMKKTVEMINMRLRLSYRAHATLRGKLRFCITFFLLL